MPPQEVEKDEALTGEIVPADARTSALQESTSQMPLIEMEVDGKDVVLHDPEWSGFHERPIPLGYPLEDVPIFNAVARDCIVGLRPNTDLYQK
jgi:hypothetical protein